MNDRFINIKFRERFLEDHQMEVALSGAEMKAVISKASFGKLIEGTRCLGIEGYERVLFGITCEVKEIVDDYYFIKKEI